jgi:hypothetical protein
VVTGLQDNTNDAEEPMHCYCNTVQGMGLVRLNNDATGQEVTPYKSKSGRKFLITKYPIPSKGDLVYFTQDEWEWMKEQKLRSEEFDALWEFKKDDHTYQMIPDKDNAVGKTLADNYVPAILEEIKRKIPCRVLKVGDGD